MKFLTVRGRNWWDRRIGSASVPSELTLNVEQVTDPTDRDNLMAWLAADATRATASWNNEGNGELTWIHDGQRYQVEALARRICTEAGIAFPDTRPGPHWWLDPAQDNKSLVQISGG